MFFYFKVNDFFLYFVSIIFILFHFSEIQVYYGRPHAFFKRTQANEKHFILNLTIFKNFIKFHILMVLLTMKCWIIVTVNVF